MHAICAHYNIALDLFAIIKSDYTLCGIDINNPTSRPQHSGLPLAFLTRSHTLQLTMQTHAMRQLPRMLPSSRISLQINAEQLLPIRKPLTQPFTLHSAVFLGDVPHAPKETIGVWSQMHSCTEFVCEARLFEESDVVSLRAEENGSGEAADSCADYGNIEGCGGGVGLGRGDAVGVGEVHGVGVGLATLDYGRETMNKRRKEALCEFDCDSSTLSARKTSALHQGEYRRSSNIWTEPKCTSAACCGSAAVFLHIPAGYARLGICTADICSSCRITIHGSVMLHSRLYATFPLDRRFPAPVAKMLPNT